MTELKEERNNYDHYSNITTNNNFSTALSCVSYENR